MILNFLVFNQQQKKVDVSFIHRHLFLKAFTITEVRRLVNRLIVDKNLSQSKDGHLRLTDGSLQHLQAGGYSTDVKLETPLVGGGAHKEPSLFMSYCWAESKIADQIFKDLSQINIRVIKDNHQLRYKDSLSSFMTSIRDYDFAILLISDGYLKSKNCMNEVLELLKEKDYLSKILPIIIDGTCIYKASDRLAYIRYWEQQCLELQTQLAGVNPINSVEVIRDLRHTTTITQQMDAFVAQLTDMLHVSFAELQRSGYRELLEKMNFEDITFTVALLAVARTPNVERREIMLDDYIRKGYPLNSYFYSIKATTNADGKKFEQARINLEEAIRQNPRNAEAHNNLGLLYNDAFRESAKAIGCFRKADSLYPRFTVAKLNLAFVIARSPGGYPEAIQINRDIIAYDPDEPKAYNNIATYLKMDFNKNFEECERLYLKAIELDTDYIEPYIGYANLLKLVKRTEEGNKWYRKARAKDKMKYYKPVIDAALKSEKG